ncbi:MAG: hypothetical protein LR015_09125 [Verrucomicrobia bacterium]|nr:hypothetical protein [Verrucomicrobiota bacterium]
MRKNIISSSLLISLTAMAATAFANDPAPLQVSISTFQQPSGANPFTGFPAAVDARFAPLFSVVPDSRNDATHILIEGLVPIQPGSNTLVSNYSAYNLETQQLRDGGTLFLTADPNAQLPSTSVASPIVGLVRRDAPFSSFTATNPVAEVGGASGASSFSIDPAVINVNLQRDQQTFTGTVSFEVVDANTLQMTEDLVLGGFSYRPATLVRDGLRFYGLLESRAAQVDYNASMLVIELTGLTDSNGDGIPDISDDSFNGVVVIGDINLAVGSSLSHPVLGQLVGITAEGWAGSNFLYNVFVGEFTNTERWVYSDTTGWLWMAPTAGTAADGIWSYSPEKGWLHTNSQWQGLFRVFGPTAGGNQFGYFGTGSLVMSQ